MVNNEILSFVKEQIAQGKSKDEIRDMLVTHGGWDNKDVEEAFDNISLAGTSMPGLLSAMEKKEITPMETMPVEPAPVSTPNQAPARVSAPVITQPAPVISPSFARPFPPEPKTPEPLNLTPEIKTGVNAFTSPIAPAPITTPTPVAAQPPIPAPEEMPSQEILSAIPGMEPPLPPQQTKVDLLSEIRNRFAASTPVSASIPTSNPTPFTRTPNVGVTPPITAQQSQMPPQPRVMQPRGQAAPIIPPPVMAPRMNIKLPNNQQLPQVQQVSKPQAIMGTGMPYQQATTVIKQKPQGRKALGFVMFLIGLILGSVGTHAYLSGYFVTFSSWIGL